MEIGPKPKRMNYNVTTDFIADLERWYEVREKELALALALDAVKTIPANNPIGFVCGLCRQWPHRDKCLIAAALTDLRIVEEKEATNDRDI